MKQIKRILLTLITVVLVVGVAGCNLLGDRAVYDTARVEVTASTGVFASRSAESLSRVISQDTSPDSIAQVLLTVVGENKYGIPQDPLATGSLTLAGGTWGVTVDEMPLGPALTFTLQAFDASGVLIYTGSTTTVLSQGNLNVGIILVPYDDGSQISFPVIRQIIRPAEIVQASSAEVTVAVAGSANETVVIDTVAGGGSFSPAGPVSVPLSSGAAGLELTYTAPTEPGTYLHEITVTNEQGFSVKRQFTTVVVWQTETGSIDVGGIAPAVTGLSLAREDSLLSMTAEVADDGPVSELSYDWSYDGGLTFADATTNPAVLTGYSETATGTVTLTVTDSDTSIDATGLSTTVTFLLPEGLFPDAVVRDSGTAPDFASWEILGEGYTSSSGSTRVDYVQGYAYVADLRTGLNVIDVSDADNPGIVGQYRIPNRSHYDVAVAGSVAFLALGPSGLHMLDITDPTNPTFIGSSAQESFLVRYADGLVYSRTNTGIDIIDVSDPANPSTIGTTADLQAIDFQISDTYLYAAGRQDGMHIIDITDPTSPSLVSTYTYDSPITTFMYAVDVVGSLAYVTGERTGLLIVDVSDPGNPTLLAQQGTGRGYGIQVVDDIAYVASDQSGLQLIDVSTPSLPSTATTVPGTRNAFDVELSGSQLYLAGRNAAFKILDIADVSGPRILAKVGTSGWTSDVELVGNTALLVDIYEGLFSFDVSDPSAPEPIGSLTPSSAGARNVAVDGSHAYLAGGYSLFVVDIADPAELVELTRVPVSGVWDVAASNGLVFVTERTSGLAIIDASTPSGATVVTRLPLAGYTEGVAVVGSTVYVGNTDAGVVAFDVSDPSSPTQLGALSLGGRSLRRITVDSGKLYTTDGVTMYEIDVSNPASMAVVRSVRGVSPWGDMDAVAGNVLVPAGPLYVVDMAADPGIYPSAYVNTGSGQAVTLGIDNAYIADGRLGLVVVGAP